MIEVVLVLTISFIGPIPIAVYDSGQSCTDDGAVMMRLIVNNRPDMAPHVHYDCVVNRHS